MDAPVPLAVVTTTGTAPVAVSLGTPQVNLRGADKREIRRFAVDGHAGTAQGRRKVSRPGGRAAGQVSAVNRHPFARLNHAGYDAAGSDGRGRRPTPGCVSCTGHCRPATRHAGLVDHLGRRISCHVHSYGDQRVAGAWVQHIAACAHVARTIPPCARHRNQRQTGGDRVGDGYQTNCGDTRRAVRHRHRVGGSGLTLDEAAGVRQVDAHAGCRDGQRLFSYQREPLDRQIEQVRARVRGAGALSGADLEGG